MNTESQHQGSPAGKYLLSAEGRAKLEEFAAKLSLRSESASVPNRFAIRRTLTPPDEFNRAIAAQHPSLQAASRRFIRSLDYTTCGMYKSQKYVVRLKHQPERAAQYPYIFPNTKGCLRYIVIDIDHKISDALQRQEDRLIPLPTFWVESGDRSAHLVYELDSAWCGKGLSRVKALAGRLVRIWGADKAILAGMAKNPLSHEWRLNARMSSGTAYDLQTLWSLVFDIDIAPFPRPHGSGRNQTMFDHLRRYACKVMLGESAPRSVSALCSVLRGEARRVIGDVRAAFAGKQEPYPLRQAYDTCKSVAKHTFPRPESELRRKVSRVGRDDRKATQEMELLRSLVRIGAGLLSGKSLRVCEPGGYKLRKHGLVVQSLKHTASVGPRIWALGSEVALKFRESSVSLQVTLAGVVVCSSRPVLPGRAQSWQTDGVGTCFACYVLPWGKATSLSDGAAQ